MLAQNFKTAADLGIKDVELDALIKVLGMLERNEIDAKHFDMQHFVSDCGTVGCICGWAYIVSGRAAFPEVELNMFEQGGALTCRLPDAAVELFGIFRLEDLFGDDYERAPTPHQAAIALRSYLTTGDANWAEALA